MNASQTRAETSSPVEPRRVRCKLNSIDDVKAKLGRIYREAKGGTRDVADVSKLANILSILGRMIEGSDLERRLEALEKHDA